jgi:hypothetical protein
MAVARERLCKSHVTSGYLCDKGNATIEEVWVEVFTMRSAATVTSHYNKTTVGRGVFRAVRAEANYSKKSF